MYKFSQRLAGQQSSKYMFYLTLIAEMMRVVQRFIRMGFKLHYISPLTTTEKQEEEQNNLSVEK